MKMMSEYTVMITHAPYGQEKPFTALRFVQAAFQHKVNIFLIEDGVYVAKKGQKADVRVEDMLKDAINSGVTVKLCGNCMQARGLSEDELVEGAEMGLMKELVEWVERSDKVLTF
jgi:tRNA 2-thiouridine synthesizing protein D